MALENYIIGASNAGAAGYHNAMAGMDQRKREAEVDRHNAFNRMNVDRQYKDTKMREAFEMAALMDVDETNNGPALDYLDRVSDELGVQRPERSQIGAALKTRRQQLMQEGRGNGFVNELIAAGYEPGSPEFIQARDTHFGLTARPEPASTTNQPLGTPINRGGKRYQTVQRPDGTFAEIELGDAPDETVPDYVGKAIIESSDKYQSALSKAESAERMAADFKTKFGNIPAGAMGAASEAVKSFFGSQDDISLARREWQSLKNALVTEQLPPGVASDRDIALIRQGFPDDFSNPAMLADFLIARANVLRGIAEYEGFKSEYLSENKTTRGVLEAWKKKKGFRSDIQTVEDM